MIQLDNVDDHKYVDSVTNLYVKDNGVYDETMEFMTKTMESMTIIFSIA